MRRRRMRKGRKHFTDRTKRTKKMLHLEDGRGRNLKQRGGGSVAVLVISGLSVAVGVVSLSLCQVEW